MPNERQRTALGYPLRYAAGQEPTADTGWGPSYKPGTKPSADWPPPYMSPAARGEAILNGGSRPPPPYRPEKENAIPWSFEQPEVFFKMAAEMYGGKLSPKQVEGLSTILRHGSGISIADLAYALATADHETRRFETGREVGLGKGRPYGRPGRNGGQVPYGRGFSQTTGDGNYEEFDKRLGLDGQLVRNYDLALDPDISAKILIYGLTRSEGFTGVGTPHFLPRDGAADEGQFRKARRAVNGTDRAEDIAKRAIGFQDALGAARYRYPAQPD